MAKRFTDEFFRSLDGLLLAQVIDAGASAPPLLSDAAIKVPAPRSATAAPRRTDCTAQGDINSTETLATLIESGLSDSFEVRLDRWQGLAESGRPEDAMQALVEIARERELTLPRIVKSSYAGLLRVLSISAFEAHAESDVRAAPRCAAERTHVTLTGGAAHRTRRT